MDVIRIEKVYYFFYLINSLQSYYKYWFILCFQPNVSFLSWFIYIYINNSLNTWFVHVLESFIRFYSECQCFLVSPFSFAFVFVCWVMPKYCTWQLLGTRQQVSLGLQALKWNPVQWQTLASLINYYDD